MAERSQLCWERCYGVAQKRLPVLQWLPKYSLQWVQLDLIAGLTVGLTVVPQALAYAEVAGLPVQYGLYSSFMGCFVYCLLGTSKDVTLGPTAIMSLLVSSYAFHDPVYAILLSFLSGCIQIVMGLLHLGLFLDFISYPVIKGFTSAAAVTIGFNQVKSLLGLQKIPRQFFLQLYYTFYRIGETRAADAILGVLCLVVLVGLQQMKNHVSRAYRMERLSVRIGQLVVWATATARNALVVLFAGLVAYSFQVTGSQPFTLTGAVPQGLPPFQPPPFSKATVNGTVSFGQMAQAMGAGLAVVPLMGLLETIAIAKAFASQNNYQIDPNQELLAMGFTNLLGSFVSSYPVTGSFGRTALNAQTSVCTPAGGLLTGVLVLLSLAYLTSLFYFIPKAALAAVIICAVAPMFDARIFHTLWRVKRLDLVPLCVTFFLCFWEVQYGIMAGVLVSGLVLLYPIARPQIKVLEYEALLLQPASGLYFPAIEFIRETVQKHALSASRSRSVILDCTHVSSIDYTVVMGLSELLQEFQSRRISLVFISLQAHVLQVLLAAELEGFCYFSRLEDAVKSLKEELHRPNEALFDDSSDALLPSGIIQ
ncbi:sodium-independent sulfate anion transporter [Tiliqua scincoides]|uniref:sodium-independent sulfate anion transporter n=1 Tax=Tiliqua scincoides TaxID=71010 RepID=UPI0034631A7A